MTTDSNSKQEAGRAGGEARANALDPERRAAIAKAAAQARWTNLRATHGGVLEIGDVKLPCFVLSDGRRVLTNAAMITSLSMKQGGYRHQSLGRPASDRLARFVGSRSLKAHVSNELCLAVAEPIRFRPQGTEEAGKRIWWGYEATVLADICEAILAAREEGTLDRQQERIALRAEVLVRAFARVGIIALVDEATGYQEVRARNELHRILEKYISPQLLPWAKRFPDEFYSEMFRLRNWEWTPTLGRKPMMAGKLTIDVVYARLPPGVLAELRAKNPVDDKGRRKHAHHQYLTADVGHPHLEKHLVAVITLMKISKSWRQLLRFVNDAFPRSGDQRQFDGMDPEDRDDN